jgi:hypothetical protein
MSSSDNNNNNNDTDESLSSLFTRLTSYYSQSSSSSTTTNNTNKNKQLQSNHQNKSQQILDVYNSYITELGLLLRYLSLAKSRANIDYNLQSRVLELGKNVQNINEAIRLITIWRAMEERLSTSTTTINKAQTTTTTTTSNEKQTNFEDESDLWLLADSISAEPGTPLFITKQRLLELRRKAVEDLISEFDSCRRTSDFLGMRRYVEILNHTMEGSTALRQFLVRLAIRPITLALKNPPINTAQVQLLFSQLSISVNECMTTLQGLPSLTILSSNNIKFIQDALIESNSGLPALFALMFPRMNAPPPSLAKERVQLLVATRRCTENLFNSIIEYNSSKNSEQDEVGNNNNMDNNLTNTNINSSSSGGSSNAIFSFFGLEFPKLELSMFEGLFNNDFPSQLLDKDDSTRVLIRKAAEFVEEKLIARAAEAHARRVLFFSTGTNVLQTQNTAFAESLVATTCARFRDVMNLIIQDTKSTLPVNEQYVNEYVEMTNNTKSSIVMLLRSTFANNNNNNKSITTITTKSSLLKRASSSNSHGGIVVDTSNKQDYVQNGTEESSISSLPTSHLIQILQNTFETIETCSESLAQHVLQVQQQDEDLIAIVETTLSYVESELVQVVYGFIGYCYKQMMRVIMGENGQQQQQQQQQQPDTRYSITQGEVIDHTFTQIGTIFTQAIQILRESNIYNTNFGNRLAALTRNIICLRLSRLTRISRSCGVFIVSRELAQLSSTMDEVLSFDSQINHSFASQCKQMGLVFVVGNGSAMDAASSDVSSMLNNEIITILLEKIID